MSYKIFLLIFFLSAFGIFLYMEITPKSDENQSLTQQLEQKAAMSRKNADAKRLQIMDSATDKLRKSNIIDSALTKGQRMPEFSLPDASGKIINSKDLIEKGPVVIVFYRGGWCPYCNLHLRDLQKNIDAIYKTGATIVAISPQAPPSTKETKQKNQLDFFVLSDVKNIVANKFGLVFELPQDLIELYQSFGIDLTKSNAGKEWKLPLAATYIVNKSGEIVYSFLDVDYKKRAETKDIIAFLKNM
jgi:peroxiredoxin